MLEIQTKNVDPDIVVLEIVGRVTMGRDSKQLEWSTDNLVRENRKKIVFDLSGVSHIDSTGIGIIVMAAGQIQRAGGKLMVCAQGPVEKVLRMTNVDKVVNLCADAASAVGAFS
jgi:anti-sigma B factor antagonist